MPGHELITMSAVVVPKSDESRDENCLVALEIAGDDYHGALVMLPREDISFERIRHEIARSEVPVPKPFRFTLGAGGKPISKEEEDNWSDWSIFAQKEGFEYCIFIEKGKATRINHVNVSRRPHGPVYHLLHGGKVPKSDESSSSSCSGDYCFFEIKVLGEVQSYVVEAPRNEISFKRLRQEIIKDIIHAPTPFRFVVGADGKPLSEEQEDSWWDWEIFTKQQGRDGKFGSPYRVCIEEGKAVAS